MTVYEKDNHVGLVAAYTKNGQMADSKSMHLAIHTGKEWEELNFGMGVLFAEANLCDGTAAGTTKVLKEPFLWRGDDGKIGVAAKTMTVDGIEDDGFAIWETNDLVSYIPKERVTSIDEYKERTGISINGTWDIGADVPSVLSLSKSEADYLRKKLGEVKNTSVEPININTSTGVKVTQLPNLTAYYSDGSIEEIPVIWNENQLKEIDFNKPGVYQVQGEAVVKDYESPMIYGTADPVIYLYNNQYYFIATNEEGNQLDIYLRCANTIEELSDAKPVRIFEHTLEGDHSGCNWAPELHQIGGALYCLFASSTTGRWDGVQSRIMKCNGDPMNPSCWEAPVRVVKQDGSNLIEEGITLDMTYFEANEKSYYCWAQRPIDSKGIGNSDLFIAQVNPLDPYKLASESVRLLSPKYAWDRQNTTVDEGPYVLKKDGKLYMTFSGDSVSNYYCLGLLIADENADLLNPASWEEVGYPVLSSVHVEGEFGPGHNAFTTDEYGRDVIVFHMKPNGGMRSSTLRTIHYAFDGTPIFYMTAERFLKEEYRNVKATIIVGDA